MIGWLVLAGRGNIMNIIIISMAMTIMVNIIIKFMMSVMNITMMIDVMFSMKVKMINRWRWWQLWSIFRWDGSGFSDNSTNWVSLNCFSFENTVFLHRMSETFFWRYYCTEEYLVSDVFWSFIFFGHWSKQLFGGKNIFDNMKYMWWQRMIKIWICKYVSKTIITGWFERQWRESIAQWRTSRDSLE